MHQKNDWPKFTWDADVVTPMLGTVRHRQGKILGVMQGLGFRLQEETVLKTLTLDVLKSSEIEGEQLNPEQLRSSIARLHWCSSNVIKLTLFCHFDEGEIT